METSLLKGDENHNLYSYDLNPNFISFKTEQRLRLQTLVT